MIGPDKTSTESAERNQYASDTGFTRTNTFKNFITDTDLSRSGVLHINFDRFTDHSQSPFPVKTRVGNCGNADSASLLYIPPTSLFLPEK